MFWKQREAGWPIDPSKVAFGSVVDASNGNLSRTHVMVRYRGWGGARYVPVADFIRGCHDALLSRRPLKIERLVVAPIIQRRYEKFFDKLTDWEPARRIASRSARETTSRQPSYFRAARPGS
jgi:hypothetical protein